MPEQAKTLEGAVVDAANTLNNAVNLAADAGILVEISVETDNPDLTSGASPRPKVVVNVHRD